MGSFLPDFVIEFCAKSLMTVVYIIAFIGMAVAAISMLGLLLTAIRAAYKDLRGIW